MIEATARRNFAQGLLSFSAVAVFFSVATLDFANPRIVVAQIPVHPPLPPPDEPKIDKQKILKHNQEQIEQDIQRLYALATELKKEVDATNSADILSVTLLQKAEEVEKLAHQIKTLAKA